jgi:hypothetical protein
MQTKSGSSVQRSAAVQLAQIYVLCWNLVTGMAAGPSYIILSDSESDEETWLRGNKR